jgi:hypothetical protein
MRSTESTRDIESFDAEVNAFAHDYEAKAEGKAGIQKGLDAVRTLFNRGEDGRGYGDDQWKNIANTQQRIAELETGLQSGRSSGEQAQQQLSQLRQDFSGEAQRVDEAQQGNARIGQAVHGAGRMAVVGAAGMLGSVAGGGINPITGAAAGMAAGSAYDALTVAAGQADKQLGNGSNTGIAPCLDTRQSVGGLAAGSLAGKKVKARDIVQALVGSTLDAVSAGYAGQGIKLARTSIATAQGARQTAQAAVTASVKTGLQESAATLGVQTVGTAIDPTLGAGQKRERIVQQGEQAIRQLPGQLVFGAASSATGAVLQPVNQLLDGVAEIGIDGVSNLGEASVGNVLSGEGAALTTEQMVTAAVLGSSGAMHNVLQRPGNSQPAAEPLNAIVTSTLGNPDARGIERLLDGAGAQRSFSSADLQRMQGWTMTMGDGPADGVMQALSETPFAQGAALTDEGRRRLTQAQQQLSAEAGLPVGASIAALQLAQEHWTAQIDRVEGSLERAVRAQDALTRAMRPYRDLAAMRNEYAARIDSLRQTDPAFDEQRIDRAQVGEDGLTLADLAASVPPDDVMQQTQLAALRLQVVRMLEEQVQADQPAKAAGSGLSASQYRELTADLPTHELIAAQFRLGPSVALQKALQPYAEPGHRLTAIELQQAVRDNEPVLRPLGAQHLYAMTSPAKDTFYEINFQGRQQAASQLGTAYRRLQNEPMQVRTADNSRRIDMYRHGTEAEGTTAIDYNTGRALPMPRGAVEAVLDDLQIEPGVSGQLVVSYGSGAAAMSNQPLMYWSRSDADAYLAALQVGHDVARVTTAQTAALKRHAANTQPDNDALAYLLMADRTGDAWSPPWKYSADAPDAQRVVDALTGAGVIDGQTPPGDIEHIANHVFNRAQAQAYRYQQRLSVPPEVSAGQRTLEEFVHSRRSMTDYLNYIDPRPRPDGEAHADVGNIVDVVPGMFLPSRWERLAAIDDRAQRAERTKELYVEWTDELFGHWHRFDSAGVIDLDRDLHGPIAEYLLANYEPIFQFDDGRDVVVQVFDEDEPPQPLAPSDMQTNADMAFVLDGLLPIERKLGSAREDAATALDAAMDWRALIDDTVVRRLDWWRQIGLTSSGFNEPYVEALAVAFNTRFAEYGQWLDVREQRSRVTGWF